MCKTDVIDSFLCCRVESESIFIRNLKIGVCGVFHGLEFPFCPFVLLHDLFDHFHLLFCACQPGFQYLLLVRKDLESKGRIPIHLRSKTSPAELCSNTVHCQEIITGGTGPPRNAGRGRLSLRAIFFSLHCPSSVGSQENKSFHSTTILPFLETGSSRTTHGLQDNAIFKKGCLALLSLK
jgi:hypothetical protein